MIKYIALAASALGLLAAPAIQAEEKPEMTKGEKRLAEMLEGRVAGEPKSCINTFGQRSLITIDNTALVYDAGDTIWVNYTKSPRALDDSDYLVIERFSSSSLCRTDRVTTRDRFGNFLTGFVSLDDFVPYTKADEG